MVSRNKDNAISCHENRSTSWDLFGTFFKTTNVYKYSKCHLYTLGAGADQKRTGSAKQISRNMSNYRIILYRLPPTLLNLFPTVQYIYREHDESLLSNYSFLPDCVLLRHKVLLTDYVQVHFPAP